MSNHHHKPKCYQYNRCWIEIFLEADDYCDRITSTAAIEFPNNEGVIFTESYPTREEAERAAAQLIDESIR